MVTGVCCATVVHIISSQSVEILMNADDRMTSRISIITSVKNVFVPKKNEERNYGLEVIKIIFVYFAGFSHNMLCLETPLALMIISECHVHVTLTTNHTISHSLTPHSSTLILQGDLWYLLQPTHV